MRAVGLRLEDRRARRNHIVFFSAPGEMNGPFALLDQGAVLITTSIRRLMARPSTVALEAKGRSEP